MIHFDKERNEIVDDTGKNVTDEAFIAVCDMAHKIQSEENFAVANDIFAKSGVQIFFATDNSAGYMASPTKKWLDSKAPKAWWNPKGETRTK